MIQLICPLNILAMMKMKMGDDRDENEDDNVDDIWKF